MTPRRYQCRRVEGPLKIDGSMGDPAWRELPWTDDFVDITGDEALNPYYRTRVKMAWDDDVGNRVSNMMWPKFGSWGK